MIPVGNNDELFPYYRGPTRLMERYLAGEVVATGDELP